MNGVRRHPFLKLKNHIIEITPTGTWERIFNTKFNIVKLVTDCRSFTEIFQGKPQKMDYLEELAKDMCYALYVKRLQILEQ